MTADGVDQAASEPEEPSVDGRQALVESLEVRRNARYAVVFGALFAVGVAILFVGILAEGDTFEPTPYYVALAFVIFVTATMLAATVLTVRRAMALGVHPASVVRRGATVGTLGGILWLIAALGLAVDAPAARTVVGLALPWAPLLSLGGVWAVQTRDKRTTPLRPLGALGAWLALVGALVVADLAALELSHLIVSRPTVDPGVRGLFLWGAGALVAGHLCQAAAATLGDARPWRMAALVGPPALGLAGLLALGPGSLSIAVFAAGSGLAWFAVGLALRHVDESAVPVGSDYLE